MKSRKKEPPSWIKTIGDALLYGGTGGLAGKNPLASAAYDKSRSSGVLPSNANAFIKFAMGDKEGLNEKDFSDEDMAFIRSLVDEAERQGRSDVQYHDYPSGKFPEDVDKMSPEGRVMTTLGRFTFDKDDEGNYTVSDKYDFNNSKENIGYYSKILKLTPEEYIEKYKNDPVGLNFDLKRRGISAGESAYRILRGAYAPIINESRDPMPVKVKVTKKAKEGVRVIKDPTKGKTNPMFFGAFPEEPSDSLDVDALRKGIAQAESLGGVLMINPTSSATGLYGQLYNEIKDLPFMKGVSREDFADSKDLQDKAFDMRVEKGIGAPSLRRNAMELTEEYAPQLGNQWNYSLNDVAALTNLLGRQGTREFFASKRDGTEYKVPGVNKTPEQYLSIVREASKKKQR